MGAVLGSKNGLVNDGLIFSLDAANKLSSTSGSTTVSDMVNRVTGQTQNGVIVDGETWTFDGVNDNIKFDDYKQFLTLTEDFSFEVWINIANNSFYQFMVVLEDIAQTGTNDVDYGVYSFADSIFIYVGGTGANGGGATIPTPRYDRWIHVVTTFVVSTKESKIYIDGDLKNTTTATSNFTNGTTPPFYLGRPATTLNGKISNARVYQKILTPSEVKRNYETLKYRFIL